MAQVRHAAAAAIAVLLAAACAGGTPDRSDRPRRDQVGRQLDDLGQGLRSGSWSRVERFFSPSYQAGYGELRDRVEARFRTEQLTDLQFIVNRVLESDGRLNAQVRWNRAWVDRRTGRPGQATGLAEFVLVPHGDSLQILHVSGDSPF